MMSAASVDDNNSGGSLRSDFFQSRNFPAPADKVRIAFDNLGLHCQPII